MAKYTKENLKEIMLDFYNKNGRVPDSKEMKKPSYQTYIRCFGSWNEAKKYIFGDTIRITERHYTEEEKEILKQKLLDKVIEKQKELGRSPNITEIESPALYNTYFGSWNTVLEILGLEVNKRKIDRNEMIKILQQRGKELGRTPTTNDEIYPSVSAYFYEFGSWVNALKEAGFKINREDWHKHNEYTDEELIKILQERARELGKTPDYSDMKNPNKKTYTRRFGSWWNALDKAGLEYDYEIREKMEKRWNKY